MSESPPVRDREQAIETVKETLLAAEDEHVSEGGLIAYPSLLAERIVDALLPQPDPLEILGEAAVELAWQARAERAEARLQAVIQASRPVVETDAILRTLEPQEITHLRAVLSSLSAGEEAS